MQRRAVAAAPGPESRSRQTPGTDWLTARWERTREQILIIHLSGEIDYITAGLLRELATSAIEATGLYRIVLDLAGVSLCDSSGLAVLVALWKAARRQGGALALARVPAVCRRPLAIMGLDRVLGDWATVREAMAGVSAAPGPVPPSPAKPAARQQA